MSAYDDELIRKNKRTGLIVVVVLVGMVALSFASVPLYRLFCQVTGFGGTPQIGKGAGDIQILDREVRIRFNADTAPDMPWEFRPEQTHIDVKIGQQAIASYYARNKSDKHVEGTAIFNVLPENAAIYFHKIQCFCFDRQMLEGGKDAHMPVVFYIDPAIDKDPDLKDLKTITLSYTFFRYDNFNP